MTVADALALIRALSIIPIAYALSQDARGAAFVIFVAAALTDAADGWFARRQTSLAARGALIDPIADKILVVGTAGALMIAGLGGVIVPPELFALLTVREVTTGLIRVASYRAHANVRANAIGKLKTAAEMSALAILIVVRPPSLLGLAALALLWLAVIVGLITLVSLWPHRRRAAL